MKIRYAFANQDVVEIEVDDVWGNLVIDLDRQEYNNNHTPVSVGTGTCRRSS